MTRIEPVYLANIILYVKGMTTFINLRKVSKNTKTAFEMLHINPQNVCSGIDWILRVFPNINTFQGSCNYVFNELKGDKMNQITWIDASLSVTSKGDFNQLIKDKIVKLRINSLLLPEALNCFNLNTLIIDFFDQTNVLPKLKSLTFLKKVILYMRKDFYLEDPIREMCYGLKKIRFVIVIVSDNNLVESVNNVITVKRSFSQVDPKTNEPIRKQFKIKSIQKEEIENIIDDCNLNNYDIVSIEIEKANGLLDIEKLNCLKIEITLVKGNIELILMKTITSVFLEVKQGTINTNFDKLKYLTSLKLIGNVLSNKKCDYLINFNITDFYIDTNNIITIDLNKANNLNSLHIDADFEIIHFQKHYLNYLKSVFIANKRKKGSVEINPLVKFNYMKIGFCHIVGRNEGLSFTANLEISDLKIQGRINSIRLGHVKSETITINTDKSIPTQYSFLLEKKSKTHGPKNLLMKSYCHNGYYLTFPYEHNNQQYPKFDCKNLILKSNCGGLQFTLSLEQTKNNYEIDSINIKEIQCCIGYGCCVAPISYDYKNRILECFHNDTESDFIKTELLKQEFMKNVKGLKNIKVVLRLEGGEGVLLSDLIVKDNASPTKKSKQKKLVYNMINSEEEESEDVCEEEFDSPYLIQHSN